MRDSVFSYNDRWVPNVYYAQNPIRFNNNDESLKLYKVAENISIPIRFNYNVLIPFAQLVPLYFNSNKVQL